MTRQAKLRKRLELAIGTIFDGNVSAAADGLGLSQPTLHKILSGTTQEPKSSTVTHLADRLGVSEAWLRGEPDVLIDEVHHPAGFHVNPGLLLLARYFERKERDYTEWLDRIMSPKTETGARILEAYRRWRVESRPAQSDLIREAAFGAVEGQFNAGAKNPGFVAEHLRALRALSNAEIAMLELTVGALKRLGEHPT